MRIFISYLLLVIIVACSFDSKTGSDSQTKEETIEEIPEIHPQDENGGDFIAEKNGIRILGIPAERDYSDATLELVEPKKLQSGEINFKFNVEGFELKQQTEGERNRLLASSDKGQHIHFILNNGPYTAHYSPEFQKELSEGNNVILAFLARSYHESVKSPQAFVFKNISVGNNNPPFDLKSPHLIYSRPKGEYIGRIDPLLLDFYLINAELSEEGYKVRAIIDNNEFILPSWQPYMVEGLKEGEHKFRIQLIDSEGKVVPGPFNDSGERTIVLKK